MIGADFEKIQFTMFGLDLVEPMAFVTDTILAVISITLAVLISKKFKASSHPIKTYWVAFFWVFGLGAFAGGLGHVFFNQWGVAGKFPSWLTGPASIYFLEQAMIAAHDDDEKLGRYKLWSFWKMMLVYLAFSLICYFGPIHENPQIAFLPTAINTIFGVILTAGILGYSYSKRISANFKYFYIGVLILLPTAFIFLLKINLHPWFDKNDFSHVLMAIGICYFYIGAKKILPQYP